MWIRTIIIGSMGLAASQVTFAQGAFNFDEIPGVNEEPIVAVDLNSVAIGFVRAALAGVDPATADIMSGLRGIKLRVYHGESNSRQFNSFIESVGQQLEASGWQRMMSVQDQGSNVQVHMRMTEQEVSGLTVMLFDDGEAMFMNIDGTVSAEDLGNVISAFSRMGMMPTLPMPGMPPRPTGNPGPAGAAASPAD